MKKVERYVWFQLGMIFISSVLTFTDGWTLNQRVFFFLGTGLIFIALYPSDKK